MVYRTGSPGNKGALPADARLQGVRRGPSVLPSLRRGPQLPAPDQHHQPERFARPSAGHPRPAPGCAAGPNLRRLIQPRVVRRLPAAQLAPKADRTNGAGLTAPPTSVCQSKPQALFRNKASAAAWGSSVEFGCLSWMSATTLAMKTRVGVRSAEAGLRRSSR